MTKKKVVQVAVEKQPEVAPEPVPEQPAGPATPEDTAITQDGEIAVQAAPEPAPAAPQMPDPITRLANLEVAVNKIINHLNAQAQPQGPQTIQPSQGEGGGLDLMQIVNKALGSEGGQDEEMAKLQREYMKTMFESGIRNSNLATNLGEAILKKVTENIGGQVVQQVAGEIAAKA